MFRVADGMCELSRSTSGQLVANPESEHLSHWEQLINRNHLTVWRKPIQNSYLYEYKGQSNCHAMSFADAPPPIMWNSLLITGGVLAIWHGYLWHAVQTCIWSS